MKFSESWLRSLVNPSGLDSDALAHALTMAGLEVEALESVAPPFERVVVGHVLTAEKHPQADRLKLLTVDAGQGAPLQIVCGAPNVTVGMKAPCALVGARLPGGLEIKAAKVRGIESSGMMCSEKELGLAETSDGLLVLAEDAPPGADLRAWLDLDDRLFTLKLTPNRADCLSIQGIAREVSAITGTPSEGIAVQAVAVAPLPQREVCVDEPGACPRYLGRSLRLQNPECATPDWMLRRLTRSGLRSRGLVVDVTNYVLLELGQPLHAFDESRLQGAIAVRWASPAETITLLNEQRVELEPDMLVIADQNGPVALAGVMGGLESAVTPQSRDVFLESAFFAPDAIAGRARRLSLSSDSSYRFERGVDFGATRQALERASFLLLSLCGGEAGPVVERTASLPARNPVLVRPARVRRVLGMELSDGTIRELLSRLGLEPETGPQGFQVTPPSFRFDLAIEPDFVEEVARLHGYDAIPAIPPTGALEFLAAPETRRHEDDLAQLLVAREYQEVVTYSFVDRDDEAALSPQPSQAALINPIATQYSVMRSTLAAGLINTLRFNVSRKQDRLKIFEIGRCFSRSATGYEQSKRVGGLLYGLRHPEQWAIGAEGVDFYDLKGDVEALLPQSGARFTAWADHPALHPGRASAVSLNGKQIGWIGELHPKLAAQYEFPKAPLLFELDLEPLLAKDLPHHRETSRFQPIRRDLAVLVPESVLAGDVLDALQAEAPTAVSELSLFDLYQGSGVPSGKKSLAFRIVMQDTERTLTEADLESCVAVLLKVLQSRFNAELR
ncbi:MAG: phenylalanine--tRNA ligase subunit beta [Betaproteobacteria bacterium]|nr:phenylalanine--tRNA ligase subunit beta [Betaproteobacteria bacterium]